MECTCGKEMTIEEVDFGQGDESDKHNAWWCEDCQKSEYIEPEQDDSDWRNE